MAAVTVFVDDAVLGRMPDLCVKTGAPAEGLLTIHTPVGAQAGLGIWWLLALAGPPGWLGLFLIALTDRGGDEILTVQVPWTEAAQHQHEETKRRRRSLWLLCLGLVGLAIAVLTFGAAGALSDELGAMLFAGAGALGIAAVVAGFAVGRALIDVTLDASRRWVTLHRVHNDFARAVEASRSGRHPAAPWPGRGTMG